ncbi:MAG TPA: PIN domain-containing protein [Candidatus Bathyarchaeia archaeon]|nr:PIN domain-containing protein [Candidatus Bathyarchaeia archaeon]
MSSSIKLRALLDTNVFIYAFEVSKSNSNLILNALNQNQFEAIITESAFKEVYQYFRKHHSKKLADQYRIYLFTTCKIVFSHQLQPHFRKYIDEINGKDIEQLTATREFGIKYLVSYDKHFAHIEEYRTPKQFAKILRLQTYLTNY